MLNLQKKIIKIVNNISKIHKCIPKPNYTYMHIFPYKCICVYIQMHLHIGQYTCTKNAHIHIPHMQWCTYMNICSYAHIYICIDMHVHISLKHLRTCVCMHLCAYAHILICISMHYGSCVQKLKIIYLMRNLEIVFDQKSGAGNF